MMVITSLTGDMKHHKAMSMRPNGFTRQMKLWRSHHVTKPYQAVLICYSTRELPDSLSNAVIANMTRCDSFNFCRSNVIIKTSQHIGRCCPI